MTATCSRSAYLFTSSPRYRVVYPRMCARARECLVIDPFACPRPVYFKKTRLLHKDTHTHGRIYMYIYIHACVCMYVHTWTTSCLHYPLRQLQGFLTKKYMSLDAFTRTYITCMDAFLPVVSSISTCWLLHARLSTYSARYPSRMMSRTTAT